MKEDPVDIQGKSLLNLLALEEVDDAIDVGDENTAENRSSSYDKVSSVSRFVGN